MRPGAIYGAERTFQQRLGRRLGSRAILLIGGRNEIPLSYVENTASLLVRCAEHPRAAGETFNAIDPEPPRQWRYLAALLRAERRTLVVPMPLAVFRGLGAGYELLEPPDAPDASRRRGSSSRTRRARTSAAIASTARRRCGCSTGGPR